MCVRLTRAASLKHIRDKQGRAMARALAKRQVEEKTGNVPLTRKYPVLRTNTLYHMEEVRWCTG